MASIKGYAKKAFRALKRARFSTRVAKAGANNVGKAMYKAKKKGKRRSYRRMRRY